MVISFVQVYTQQGAEFPFTTAFQRYLLAKISSLVSPSGKFIKAYDEDFTLRFYISAKHELENNEVRGPTVIRKTKDVEYTIFLPFEVIIRQPDPRRAALVYLFQGLYEV